jgi:hypothetical protein
MEPIRTNDKQGTVLILSILASSLLNCTVLRCADLSIELRLTIYFANRTKQENRSCFVAQDAEGVQKPINISSTENISAQAEKRAGSLARLGHLLDVQKVTGSNPVRPTTIQSKVKATGRMGEKAASGCVFFCKLVLQIEDEASKKREQTEEQSL